MKTQQTLSFTKLVFRVIFFRGFGFQNTIWPAYLFATHIRIAEQIFVAYLSGVGE